jgi:asparagine synthase (glutamine-hydrolysing)
MFQEYGEQCLPRLNGQFAFAIWDDQAGKLFLARDRVGILPLFYFRDQSRFVFGSEIKAIFGYPGIPATLDPGAIAQTFQFWAPVGERTAFQGIRALNPGTYAWVAPGGDVRQYRYWQLQFPWYRKEPDQDPRHVESTLRELLEDAVRIRLRADVPVGAYLSGGLDSSAVTSIARKFVHSKLETFSLAFHDADYDESVYQRQMAQILGTTHHTVACSDEDIAEAVQEMVWHTEVPTLRTAPAPLYLLSHCVRQSGIKVVLTGEGADEFWAGYNIFKEAKVRRFWARQPQSERRPDLFRVLYPYITKLNAAGAAYQRAFFGHHLLDQHDLCYSHRLRWRGFLRLHRLLAREVMQTARESSEESDRAADAADVLATLPDEFRHWSPLAQGQYLEATLFLPNYLLSSQGDRMLMAHSVEGRFPFLDPRLVDACGQLAPRLKMAGLNEKWMLKRIMREQLPAAIWQRPKRPYRAPIHSCFVTQHKLKPWVAELLTPQAVAASGLFDDRAVAALADKVAAVNELNESDAMALTGVVTSQLLQQLFIENRRDIVPIGIRDDVKVVWQSTPAQR